MTTFLFAGGGSIGHIAPSVAVWRAIEEMEPEATSHFACSTKNDDREFLAKERLDFTALGLHRVTLGNLLPSISQARRLLREKKPNVIFTKGGGVTIPIAIAGWMAGIPIVVHESDVVPGRGTRLLSWFARETLFGFPSNPVRKEITRGSREEGLRITGLSGQRPILLVIGGSMGAQTLNDTVNRYRSQLLEYVDIIHITGEGKGASAKQSGYWAQPFVHEQLPHLYAAANFAVSRPGAGSISELCANSLPAIFVPPLAGVGHDHQLRNAELLEKEIGTPLLLQEDLDITLVEKVREMATSPSMCQTLGNRMHKLFSEHAAEKVAKILLAHARKHCRVS